MKILILSPKVPYPPNDGGAIATLSMAKSLKNAGNDITFLSINTNKHFVKNSDIPEKLIKDLKLKTVSINTNIKFWEALFNLFFSKLPYNGSRFYKTRYRKELKNTLRNELFDVVQLEGLYMSLYLKQIKIHTDAPVVLRAHNVEHIIWKRNYKFEKNWLKKWYYKILAKRVFLLEKNVLLDIDAVIPITQHDQDIFLKFNPKTPSHVAVAGIDIGEVISDPQKVNYSSVFFIGALDWIPNQEGLKWFINNVWPEVFKKYPTKKFHVAGRNAPEWIIKLCKKRGVVFHGEVANAKEFMLAHGIMVVPLFAGSGMRIKILEGMARGIAIISTKIGAEGINASEKEEILIANSKNDFTEKICFLYENNDICKKIGQKASDFTLNSYNNLEIAQSLTKFFKSII